MNSSYIFLNINKLSDIFFQIPKLAEVRYHYNAYLEYGDEPFDSTYMRGSPEKVYLDADEEKAGILQIIQGLTIALRTMQKNEQARFLVRCV